MDAGLPDTFGDSRSWQTWNKVGVRSSLAELVLHY